MCKRERDTEADIELELVYSWVGACCGDRKRNRGEGEGLRPSSWSSALISWVSRSRTEDALTATANDAPQHAVPYIFHDTRGHIGAPGWG